MAPEFVLAIKHETHADESPLQYDEKCDIFSFGKTLQYANVFGVSMLTPDATSDANILAEMVMLSAQCCSKNPADRPTAELARTMCLAMRNLSGSGL
jgi:hypothetical protein